MRRLVTVLCLALSMVTSAVAQVNVGINLSIFPELVPVPGYPVYYAPNVASNFFFYDGLYWVYHGDNWYASSWYNGPWRLVAPTVVPLFVLRIPVRYYRHPPAYFHAWRVGCAAPVGVSIGVMNGSGVKPVGTDGIEALLQLRPRCRSTTPIIGKRNSPRQGSTKPFNQNTRNNPVNAPKNAF